MPMFLASPGGPEKRPAVLVIQGMHGANSFELHVAERLAEQGYVGAVPDLLHRGPACFSFPELEGRRNQLNDLKVTGDVNSAIAYLQSRPYVQADQIGIVGFCMGGRVSYLMAATSPVIRVAADFYGGGVLQREGGPSPFEMTASIRCPIIVFDGEQDEHPSPDEVATIDAELARHGVTHEVHIYPGVGHAFMSREGPLRRGEVIEDAWSRLSGWLQEYLPSEPIVPRD